MKIFLAGTSFAPSYGGPAITVARLAQELSVCGLHVSVWAPDGSAAQLKPAASEHGFRLLSGDLAAAWQAFGAADLIHDNGLWWRHNRAIASLARRHNVPRIVSTRGMLQPWCFRHKRWKKALAWQLYQRRDLQHAAALHVTSLAEAEAALELGITTPAVMVPNGIDIPPLDPDQEPPLRDRGQTGGTALFLGRLYPVKGLDLLLRAWAQLRPPGWQLRLAGPDEAGYLATLQDLTRQLRLSGSVTFVGAVAGEQKHQELRRADLLVLPSRSESFGLVIAEALAHQIPVLTTTATPWNQLEQIGAGWLCEPDVEALAAALKRVVATNPHQRAAMGVQGRRYVSEQLSWTTCARQFLALYSSLLASA